MFRCIHMKVEAKRFLSWARWPSGRNDASKIGLIQVYLKPTDYTAYYVINSSYEGKIPLFE